MQNHTGGEIRNSIVLFMLFMIVLPFLFSGCASNTTPQSNEGSVKSQAYQAYKDALFEKVGAGYPKYFLDKRYDTAFIGFSNSEASKKIINDFINGIVDLEPSNKKVVARGILILLACKQSEVTCDMILKSNNLTEDDARKMVGF